MNIEKAVKEIKQAILQSQGRTAKMINGEMLSLYFGVGLYVSENSRAGFWGTSAVETISNNLRKELPGLRGFSVENIKKMRTFAEYWQPFFSNRSLMATDLNASSSMEIIETDCFALQKWSPLATEISREEFLSISFSHHMEILHKKKDIAEILFYIHESVVHHWNKIQLRTALNADIYRKGKNDIPNNFASTITTPREAIKAIEMFKDEYLLDYINVEDINKDFEDVDERIVEKEIIRNIKKFIMTFGHDFAFIGNQYHLEAYNEELFPDLLFFNRELNALVVVELKIGRFKTAYLGQLAGYMQILDDKVRKPHENPTIGIVLCKEMNRAYAEYAVRDYSKPMGVATYRTLDDMPENFRKSLPDLDDMTKLL